MSIDFANMDADTRQAYAKQLYTNVVERIIADLLSRDDLDDVPAQPLYTVYRAVATGNLGDIYKQLDDLNEQDATDRDDDLKPEIARRLKLIRSLQDDEDAQRAEWLACKADPVHFITNWGWTLDPKRKGLKTIPFVPWPKQVELIGWILDRYDAGQKGIISKARDVGVSTIVAFLSLWFLLFDPGSQVGLSSYKMEFLHTQGQPKSLFEKIRQPLQLLPEWLQPDGFTETQHFNHCSIVNPANGANTMGEVGKDVGRGGRAGIYFCDEFSKFEHQEKAFTSLTATTDCAIMLGTAHPGSYFGELQKLLPTFIFDWTCDPRKPPNFKEICLANGMTAETFAVEYECNGAASMTNSVINPLWIDAAIKIELNPSSPTVAGLDPAGNGGDESSVVIRKGPVVSHIETWNRTEVRQTTTKATGIARRHVADFLYYDASGLGSQVRNYLAQEQLPFEHHAIFGQLPAEHVFVGEDIAPAPEMYQDLITQLWFELRSRLEKTYRHHTGQDQYPEDELLSLPDDETLREQLLSRTWHFRSNGKIKLDDKSKLSTSPDRADALAVSMSTYLQRQRNRAPVETVSKVDESLDRMMTQSAPRIEF